MGYRQITVSCLYIHSRETIATIVDVYTSTLSFAVRPQNDITAMKRTQINHASVTKYILVTHHVRGTLLDSYYL